MREIDFLLTSLVDTGTGELARAMQDRLLDLIPVGHHPAPYVEHVKDPGARMALRNRFLLSLNDQKIRHDITRMVRDAHSQGEIDLELGSFLISRLSGDVEISPEEFRRKLDELAREIRPALDAAPPGKARLEAFCQAVFQDLGFRGNTEHYYSAENSYIHRVLETRTGIPITLSVIALLIAARVRLPLSGVNLPGHFLLRYAGPDGYTVCMDPFNGGALLTEDDCLLFLARQGIDPSPAHLARAGHAAILKRMYRNLINFHVAAGNLRAQKTLKEHAALLDGFRV